jgi:peptide/nickel transport system ATP-binding protein
MASIPRRRLGLATPAAGKRLSDIPGIVPSLLDPIQGCAFAPRCAFATPRCHAEAPPLVRRGPGHEVACWEVDRVLAS